jgi:hypothetical protein
MKIKIKIMLTETPSEPIVRLSYELSVINYQSGDVRGRIPMPINMLFWAMLLMPTR